MKILKETNQNVDKFMQLYAEDRFKARLFSFDNQPVTNQIIINEKSTDVFQIFFSQKTYGVSVTMKLYARRKDTMKIFVNKTKFYVSERNRLFPVCLCNLNRDIINIFLERFPWIRFLQENNFNNITFNTIVKYGLYSKEKVLKWMYGQNKETSYLLFNNNIDRKLWINYKKSLSNISNLYPEILRSDFFIDTVQLAFKLNEKVNCAWSLRRLEEEHNRMSKQYTDTVLEISNRPLIIHPIFVKLNSFLDGGLITDTKNLALEGKSQRHCVASYSHYIDKGKTGIFHIKGHTAEVINTGKELQLRQFRGRMNVDAPEFLRKELQEQIFKFNISCTDRDYIIDNISNPYIEYNFNPQLPF